VDNNGCPWNDYNEKKKKTAQPNKLTWNEFKKNKKR
jgi:hypothetical protein